MYVVTRPDPSNFVQNGRGHGHLGETLEGVRFEVGLMRPFTDRQYPGDRFVTVNYGAAEWVENEDGEGGRYVDPEVTMLVKEAEELFDTEVPINNAMTLPKDVWIDVDARIEKQRRLRLRLVAEIGRANTRTVDGMARTQVEYVAEQDFGEAIQDMDGASDTRGDRSPNILRAMPLPVTHFGVSYTQRQIASSRGSGFQGIDLRAIEMGGRRTLEMIEKVTIGTEVGLTAGSSAAADSRYTGTSATYGATNFPYRIIKTDIHTPVATSPEQVVEDVLEMIDTLETNGFFGPYTLYHSTGYSRYLRDDYFRTGGTSVVRSLRERLMENETELTDIIRLDYLTGNVLILMDNSGEVAELIDGMPVTTVQYPSKGGLRQNIEVMAIQAVLWRTPANGIAGYVHGTTS